MEVSKIKAYSWNLLLTEWGIRNRNRECFNERGRELFQLLEPFWSRVNDRKFMQLMNIPEWQAFLASPDRFPAQAQQVKDQWVHEQDMDSVKAFCFQEITSRQAATMASSLGLYHLFVPYKFNGDAGVAILADMDEVDLDRSTKVGTCGRYVYLYFPKIYTVIVSVHFQGFPPGNEAAFGEAKSGIEACAKHLQETFPDETIVMVGDYNCRVGEALENITPTLNTYRFFETSICPEPTSTTSASASFTPEPVVIDRAFIRKGTVTSIESTREEKPLSDHKLISVTFQKK